LKNKNKVSICFLVTIAVSLMLLMPSSSVANFYNSAWEPNDLDVFVIDVASSGQPGDGFYMFDSGATPNTASDLLIFNDGPFNAATVYFTQVGGTWYASLNPGGTSDLTLGNTTTFGFYFYDASTGSTNTGYDVSVTTPNEAYILTDDQSGGSSTGMKVSVSDVRPVPIPGALWIFGSGLIGLVGIRRKLKTEQKKLTDV